MTGKNIIRFVVLVLLQVLVLNHISLGGYINPYLYVLFILWLPFNTTRAVLLVSAFLIGFSVDIFSNTLGLNAAASVAMAFARPLVISMISASSEFEPGSRPSIHSQGVRWFLLYTIILVLIHHFVLFYLEIFRLSEFLSTLIRVGLSSALTIVLVFLAEYLTVRKK